MRNLAILMCLSPFLMGCISTGAITESYTEEMAQRREKVNRGSQNADVQVEFTCGFTMQVEYLYVKADSSEVSYMSGWIGRDGNRLIDKKVISNSLIDRIVLINKQEGRKRAAKMGFMIFGTLVGGLTTATVAIYEGYDFASVGVTLLSISVGGLGGMALGGLFGTEKGMVGIYTFTSSPRLDPGDETCITLRKYMEIDP